MLARELSNELGKPGARMTQRNNWTATRSATFVRTNASCRSNRIPAEQLTLNLIRERRT